MSRRCQVTGIGPLAGNNVSHAHNRTKRRFLPNLQKKRIWVQELNRFVTLKISAKGIKTLNKNGTSEVARLISTKQIKVRQRFKSLKLKKESVCFPFFCLKGELFSNDPHLDFSIYVCMDFNADAIDAERFNRFLDFDLSFIDFKALFF